MAENATKCCAADGGTQIFNFCHGMPLMVRAADFNALYREAEKLRKDAERYRWLRHGDNDERGAIQRPGPQTFLLRDGLLDICCDAGMAVDAEEAAHTVAGPDVGAA